MKGLKSILKESLAKNPDALDMDWVNNDGPVITQGGIEAKIDEVDYKEIPNQLKGTVFYANGPQSDWIWDETGKCIQCKDRFGNGYRPGEEETLLKNTD